MPTSRGAAGGIAVVLMVALGSFMRVAIVLTLLPLGLVGVVLALLVGGRPLGFVAILGILSLLGMISGPMAFAIMGGLLVATMLTLVFLPAVYLTVFAREGAGPDVAAVVS